VAIFENLGSNGGGDFLPLAIYDARAGRLFKVERSLQGGQWVSDRIDITNEKPSFVFDFGSIEAGWGAFTPQGPSWAMVPYGQLIPERPTKDHKQTIRVKLYSPKYLDGVRELAANAKCVLGAINELHDRFLAAPEAAQGKVPVVRLTGSVPITTKNTMGVSTNYAPVFEIVQWVDRPAELGDRTVPPPKPKTNGLAQHAQAKPSNHVPPPPPQAAAAAEEMPF
jgi:hypothetical protein